MHTLTSTLEGGEWSVSRYGRITPGVIELGKLWIGGCVGPRAGLDAETKRKNPITDPAWNRTPVVSPQLDHYTD
jgi:hypothetical protein